MSIPLWMGKNFRLDLMSGGFRVREIGDSTYYLPEIFSSEKEAMYFCPDDWEPLFVVDELRKDGLLEPDIPTLTVRTNRVQRFSREGRYWANGPFRLDWEQVLGILQTLHSDKPIRLTRN